jgi:hypothetical protein
VIWTSVLNALATPGIFVVVFLEKEALHPKPPHPRGKRCTPIKGSSVIDGMFLLKLNIDNNCYYL